MTEPFHPIELFRTTISKVTYRVVQIKPHEVVVEKSDKDALGGSSWRIESALKELLTHAAVIALADRRRAMLSMNVERALKETGEQLITNMTHREPTLDQIAMVRLGWNLFLIEAAKLEEKLPGAPT